jgi:hypothetical protein
LVIEKVKKNEIYKLKQMREIRFENAWQVINYYKHLSRYIDFNRLQIISELGKGKGIWSLQIINHVKSDLGK